jgi:hypothetical protein
MRNNIALILTLTAVTPLLAQSSSAYRITHTYMLGGEGSWDYIVPDPPNHRLFSITSSRTCRLPRRRGTWDSIPSITACSSSRRSSGRRLPARQATGAEERSCLDHSR